MFFIFERSGRLYSRRFVFLYEGNIMEKKKAVIYARYSSHSQTEQSIEGQLKINKEYARREGYEIVGLYVDRAISGTTADRPEFQKMIKDAEKREFSYIIVYKLDRFARNRYDSAIYKNKLKKYNVKVVSATENISDSPEGVILEALLEATAEYYSAELGQKVKRGMLISAEKGNFTGGQVPLGYKVVDKKVYVDEEKADYVRWAFQEYLNGTPKKKIIDMLNTKGVRNAKGKLLKNSSLQNTFKNKKYIGITEYGGVEYNNIFPSIIEKEVFEKVQEKLKIKARVPGAGKAKEGYLLQGKAFCGQCGEKLVGDSGTSKTGDKHYYYSCGGKKKKINNCKKKSEKKGFLEWYVVEQTVEYVLLPNRLEWIADRILDTYDDEFGQSKIKEYEKRIAKLDSEANKIVDMIIKSSMTDSVIKRYEEKVQALDDQKADLEIDLAKLRIASKIKYEKDDIVLWLRKFCDGDLMDEVFRKKIIDVFINSVYVYDDKVVIYYNIKEGKQISYIDSCNVLDEIEGEVRICDSSVCQINCRSR